jgi:hypothetical protein
VIEQVPAATTVRVSPRIEHAADVVVKVTGRELPALLVAIKDWGALISVIALGEVTIMF